MRLYNFTNHSQDEWLDFFQKYGFDEITAPMHPEITPDMREGSIIAAVWRALPKVRGSHILVQGMSNVCHYAVTFIQAGGGTAYYISTQRERDEHDRFVFRPIALRKYFI